MHILLQSVTSQLQYSTMHTEYKKIRYCAGMLDNECEININCKINDCIEYYRRYITRIL